MKKWPEQPPAVTEVPRTSGHPLAERLAREAASSEYPFVRMQGLHALVEAELSQKLVAEAQAHLDQLVVMTDILKNPFWQCHTLSA